MEMQGKRGGYAELLAQKSGQRVCNNLALVPYYELIMPGPSEVERLKSG